MLLAHDVSYFSALDKVRPGDSIVWIDACRRVVFVAQRSVVTTPGALLYPPKSGVGLSLVTCWPTNALFWTTQRYVVEAAFVARRSGPTITAPTAALPDLSVPAPAALVALGLSLNDNSLLLGGLDLAGRPSRTFAEGPGPLAVEGVALEAYFATRKSIAAGNLAWWRAISLNRTALPPSWSADSPVQVTITVDRDTVRSVTLSSSTVDMQLVVRGRHLLVASVGTAPPAPAMPTG